MLLLRLVVCGHPSVRNSSWTWRRQSHSNVQGNGPASEAGSQGTRASPRYKKRARCRATVATPSLAGREPTSTMKPAHPARSGRRSSPHRRIGRGQANGVGEKMAASIRRWPRQRAAPARRQQGRSPRRAGSRSFLAKTDSFIRTKDWIYMAKASWQAAVRRALDALLRRTWTCTGVEVIFKARIHGA